MASAAKPVAMAKLAKVTKTKVPALKIPHVSDRWPTEVKQESRRLTGVTPKVVGAYQESPARFLKRSGSLRVQAGQKMKGPK